MVKIEDIALNLINTRDNKTQRVCNTDENALWLTIYIINAYLRYITKAVIYGYVWELPRGFGFIRIDREPMTKEYLEKYLKDRPKAKLNFKTLGYLYKIIFNSKHLIKNKYYFVSSYFFRKKLRKLLSKDDLHYEYEEENLDKKCHNKATRRNRFDNSGKDAFSD